MAAAPYCGPAQEKKVIRVWDLESGAVQVLGPVPGAGEGDHEAVSDIAFLGEHRILASVNGAKGGLVIIDLRDGKVSRCCFPAALSLGLAVGKSAFGLRNPPEVFGGPR